MSSIYLTVCGIKLALPQAFICIKKTQLFDCVINLALPQEFICIKKTQLFDCIISIFHNVLTHLRSLAC